MSLGVFLLSFRALIRTSIFPRLPPKDAYRLLRLIVVLVGSVALAGLGVWVWTETHETAAGDPKAVVDVKNGIVESGDIKGSQMSEFKDLG